jgi:2-methylcitrate dehydratase PrpD
MTAIDARLLAAFAHDTRLEDAPAGVVRLARLLLLDSLGVLAGGLQYPPVRAFVRGLSAAEPVTLQDAPFARLTGLGTAATWLDADSGGSFHPQGHRLPPVPTAHPAPHCLPVLLHAAAAGGVPDRRLAEVFLLACEVGMRFGVGTSLRPGLHPHGIHGPVAAALAASVLAGRTPADTAEALLLGASAPLAATLAVPMRGGTVRNVWTGLGAYYGAAAAGRAADGVRGSADLVARLLDSAVCTDLDPEELTGGLGERWRLADSYLKPYACARWIHPALDAWRAAVAGVPDPARAGGGIDEIVVETFAFAVSLDAVDVGSDMHARFSLPVCLAALALDGDLVAQTFLPDALARPEVREIAARVRLVENPGFSAALPRERPATVTARWRDGSAATAGVRNARGNPDDPLGADEVERKFRLNVAGLLTDATADAAVAALLHPTGADTTAIARLASEVLAELGC